MSEKIIKTRIINKNDTIDNWIKATNFIPKKGEVIIYNKSSLQIIDSFVDYIEFTNPVELIELVCHHYTGDHNAHPIYYATNDSRKSILCDLSQITDGDSCKIDFINHKTYYGTTELGTITENIEWTEFEMAVDWETYEVDKHSIILLEFPQGDLKYYNYPYLTETKIKVGDGVTLVNDLPFITNFQNLTFEDGTNLDSVLKIDKYSINYGYNNTTETGFEGQDRDDISTCTLGYDNVNKSIYSLVTGKNNENYGNDSLITACFNKNYGKQALICGYQNENNLADEENVNSSNNVLMAGAYNKNSGISNSVFGHHNITNGYGQTVVGKFNKDNPNTLFIVGNGVSEEVRMNALEIDNIGNISIANNIIDMSGSNIVPIPASYKTAVLTTSAKNAINEAPAATGLGTYQGGKVNRIVLSGDISQYEGRNTISFIDSKTNKGYNERICNIASRSDGRTNIEFLTTNVDFGVEGANGWASRIGNSLYIFTNSSEWSDAPNLKDLYVNNLYIDNEKSVILREDETQDFNDKIYIHKFKNSALYQPEFANKVLCGTVNKIYNRLVLPKAFFLIENPQSLIGKSIQFYTDETTFVEELIIDIVLRSDGLNYNIDYTTNNIPFNLTKADFLNNYYTIKIIEDNYEWQTINKNLTEEQTNTVNNLIESQVGDIYTLNLVEVELETPYYEKELTGDEQNLVSFVAWAPEDGDNMAADVIIYYTDDTQFFGQSHLRGLEPITIFVPENKSVQKIEILNGDTGFEIYSYTYYNAKIPITAKEYIDNSIQETDTKIKESEEKTNNYIDNAIQQAIIDSWEVGV